MILVLLGYMGSGKSSVGKLMASKLKWDFIDLDQKIEAEEGLTISELFSQKGEIYFRTKENALLKQLAASSERLIIATGGGTPCYADAMEYLTSNEKCRTVYLKLDVIKLTKRLFAEKKHRPLIAHIKEENVLEDFIRKHLFERSYYYNRSSMIINIDDDSIESTVENIVAKLF